MMSILKSLISTAILTASAFGATSVIRNDITWADLGSGDTNGTDTVDGAGTGNSTGTTHIAIQPA